MLQELLNRLKSKRLKGWTDLESSDGFCMLPWVHLYTSTQGKVTPCCLAPWEDELAMGDLNQQSLTEIWNGKPMNDLRAKMLKGEKDKRCWQCHENEAIGLRSKRQLSNFLYQHKYDWVEETNDKGQVKNSKPIYWDIRISNLCNFKCRICSHYSSSKLFEEAKELGTAAFPEAIHYSLNDFDGFMHDLEPAFNEVEEIYFAGGEPLIMEEHYQILEKLISKGQTNVKLRYSTNFSTTKFKNWDVFELWKNFDQVFIHSSLDGSHQHGEYQRSGQKWDKVLSERQRLRDVAPHVQFMISPTVSVFNVLEIPVFHKELVESGFVIVDDFIPQALKNPIEFNIQILSKSTKQEAQKLFEEHLEWLQNFNNNGLQKLHIVIAEFKAIVDYMNAEDKSEHFASFKEKTASVDRIRKENSIEFLPHLKDLLK